MGSRTSSSLARPEPRARAVAARKGSRTMMAVDIDLALREEFKRAARSRVGSVRAVVEGMVRAYLEGEIPGELILKYCPGPRWRSRG